MKTPKDLLKEMKEGDCFLHVGAKEGGAEGESEITRLVQPVFVKCRVAFGAAGGEATEKDDGKTQFLMRGQKKFAMILYNTYDEYVSRGATKKDRNCLVSEKMMPGETPWVSALRCFQEELRISKKEVEAHLVHMEKE